LPFITSEIFNCEINTLMDKFFDAPEEVASSKKEDSSAASNADEEEEEEKHVLTLIQI
jgi:hypothetical protein